MIGERLGLPPGGERKLERQERLGLGLPSHTYLVRNVNGSFGIRSGRVGLYIGELTRDQLRVLIRNFEGE